MVIDCGEVGVAGYYTFLLNGKKVFEAPSKNLITDFGWSRLANVGAVDVFFTQVQVGTSNTTPAYTDTSLGSLLASKTNGSGTVGSGTDTNGAYVYARFSYAFALGAVVGNVAEVGWKVASGDSSISSRSLVKDGAGNPAIIVVTSIDQLTVLYETRYYRAAIDSTSTVVVAGNNTSYTFRTATAIGGATDTPGFTCGLLPSKITVSHYGTGSVLGSPGSGVTGTATGALSLATITTRAASVSGSTATITMTTPVIATGSGNSTGGVVNMSFFLLDGSSILGCYSNLKAGFSPAIPKDNTKTLTYSFSFTFTRF